MTDTLDNLVSEKSSRLRRAARFVGEFLGPTALGVSGVYVTFDYLMNYNRALGYGVTAAVAIATVSAQLRALKRYYTPE